MEKHNIQGFTIWLFSDLVNFVPAVAYCFCPNLPAPFLQPRNSIIAKPCSKLGMLSMFMSPTHVINLARTHNTTHDMSYKCLLFITDTWTCPLKQRREGPLALYREGERRREKYPRLRCSVGSSVVGTWNSCLVQG